MKEIQETLAKINQFIKEKPWMDFELNSLQNKVLKLVGSTDFSYFHEIEITFHDIFYIQCPDNWKSDTSSTVIVIPEIEEQRSVNIAYEIEQGYQLIKIIPEDKGPIYISCKSVDFNTEKILYQ